MALTAGMILNRSVLYVAQQTLSTCPCSMSSCRPQPPWTRARGPGARGLEARPLSSIVFGHTEIERRSGARPHGLKVFEDFVSADEEQAVMDLADTIMHDREYRDDHYDGVITRYRECFLDNFPDPKVAAVVQRMRLWAWRETSGDPFRGPRLFPHIQMIDMEAEGFIKGHRDNHKFFGAFTCGLNLASPAVMRFQELKDGSGAGGHSTTYDCPLPRRSLYLMSKDSRWNWTHAVLASGTSCAHGTHQRSRRLSVIVRDVGPVDPLGPKWRQLVHGLCPSLPVHWLPVLPPAKRSNTREKL